MAVGRRGGHAIAAVEDDGLGFNPDGPAPDDAGRGPLGMRERVTPAGGTLDVEPAPGRGTAALARVPLARHEGGRP